MPSEEAFERADNYADAHDAGRYDPLEALGLENASACVWGWLAMNRHYGLAYGGCSPVVPRELAARLGQNAKAPLTSVVRYYFPEVRRERVAILKEVAERSPDGLVIGCCRQVPMLLYHPEMVAAFREETGIDPLKIDASNREEYERWIRWRADHFTEVLRLLRRELRALELERGRKLPVAVRVPSVGLFLNLAQGLDIEQWLREGWIAPARPAGGVRRGVHDVRPTPAGPPLPGSGDRRWGPWRGARRISPGRRAAYWKRVDGIDSDECLARTSTTVDLPLFGNAPA